MPTLQSAAVSVFVSNQSIYAAPNPTTIPLFVIATRANKPTPDGTGTALGTTESGQARIVASQRDINTSYGNPIFVTSDGVPVLGDETDEYGLLAAYSYLGQSNRAYILRANIDLGQLVSSIIEPVMPPPDGTYWINSGAVVGGVFKFNGTTWNPVPFDIFTTAPTNLNGANGDWAFDYSTLNGTLVFRVAGVWFPATNTNVVSVAGATHPLFISNATPVGAVSGDFWYKTTQSGGGTNLSLARYRAADGLWIQQAIFRQPVAPSPMINVIWEDTSQIGTTGARPLYIGTGASFIALPVFVQTNPPVTNPDTGTLWFDGDLTDFALYVQDGSDIWKSVATVVASNPTALQKVISASPPQFPNVNSIWVDVSSPQNIDNYPVIKQWNGTNWTDISATVLIQSADPVATLVANGTYWLNLGESTTRNTVKSFNPDFTGLTVVNGVAVAESGNHWQPFTGRVFGRLSQRQAVSDSLSQAITANQQIRAETNYFQLIAVPGYPELYQDMVALNTDNGEISFIVSDTPKFMIPNGIPVGREVTATEWITNSKNVVATGENGFAGTPTPYAAIYYPWGLATNPTDGNNVFVPPSYMALRTIAHSDNMAAPWFPPAGPNRGGVDNVNSVGYLNNAGDYVPVQLTRPQRDLLYSQAINPIADIPGRGLLVYGQKTMAGTATALDRINVARLIVKMKYDLQRLLEPFLFEINDPVTRRSALVVTERYLAGLKSMRALFDYAARCDESNNTPDIIDANQLFVDVAIKPAKAIEFIFVPIQVLNTGDQFPF